ncbi:MAG: tetratricopeptide repeat protein [Blastocatellia bacterium]|nr:tetratricopeptide repeat protein [Blastocatellia bacterium]
MAKTYWNIANLQTAQNNLDGSLENYGKAVEIYQQLAIDEPDNSRHLRNVALTNKNIGSVLQLRGNYENALAHFQKSLSIDSENATKNPNDVSAQLDLSFTYGTIASALRDAKNFKAQSKITKKPSK